MRATREAKGFASPKNGTARPRTLRERLSARQAPDAARTVARMPAAAAWTSGAALMDGLRARPASDVAVPGSQAAGRATGLFRTGSAARGSERSSPASAAAPAQSVSPARRIWSAARAVLATAGGAGAAYGLHALAVSLLPAYFGMVPVAAVWAVSSSVFILPLALYTRYRLALRDSPRLGGVKTFHDAAFGVLLGAIAVAVPAFLTGTPLDAFTIALPAVAGVSFALTQLGRGAGAGGGIVDAALTWGALTFLAPVLGAAVGALPLTAGGILGMAALPALTTVSFFLGYVVNSAETGQPLRLPQVRFPAYTWVMTGVVFALLTGYSPVWTNAVFALWMFLGRSRLADLLPSLKGGRLAAVRPFDIFVLAAAAWAAATGFAAPVTFLALAFLPERVSVWTEDLLKRFLPAGQAAPSTRRDPMENPEDRPARWPRFFYWAKTALALGSLAATGAILASYVFGWSSLLANLGVAAALTAIPLIFSKWLIKKVMRAQPISREQAPELYAMLDELLEEVNAKRRAEGRREYPLPEVVYIPMGVPNAFATGVSPFSAMVGVTDEMLAMTLDGERAREGLVRLLHAADPRGAAFRVFRRGVRDVLGEVPADAGPAAVVQAIQDASPERVREIGRRALRGVLGHELSHVLHRDMILGAVAGAMASGISFAAYGVLWAVGHAEAFLRDLFGRWFGRRPRPEASRGPTAEDGVQPEMAGPVSAGGAVGAALFLVKIFAALWAPVLASILQMSASRTREGHADEGGALLTGEPQSLALGLGLLTAWRPPEGFVFEKAMLPRLATQASVMTVNPLLQLMEAGALPGMPAAERALATREDNAFFNLFITHPDTGQRIERLSRMADAMDAGAR